MDNPTFRIESEGLNNGDINEIASSGILSKEGIMPTKRDGNDNFNNAGGTKLTSTTTTTSQSEHPDSAVWNKSHFSKKYKTQSTDTRGNTICTRVGWEESEKYNKKPILPYEKHCYTITFINLRWHSTGRFGWKIECLQRFFCDIDKLHELQ